MDRQTDGQGQHLLPPSFLKVGAKQTMSKFEENQIKIMAASVNKQILLDTGHSSILKAYPVHSSGELEISF